jgi:hypothetical protein
MFCYHIVSRSEAGEASVASHAMSTDEQQLQATEDQTRPSGSGVQEEQPSTSQQDRASSQDKHELSQCKPFGLRAVFCSCIVCD